MPDELGGLRSITELDVTFNQLNCLLPPSIANLACLKKIALSHNLLSNATTLAILGTSAALCRSLEFLDVSFNKLTTLPAELSLLDFLETLDCSNNCITELPKLMFFEPAVDESVVVSEGEVPQEKEEEPAIDDVTTVMFNSCKNLFFFFDTKTN